MPGYEWGTVLPTPDLIRSDLEYFPKGTDFPLVEELKAMQAAEAEKAGKLVR